MSETPTVEGDIAVIRDALIVLGGYLPYFSADPRKVRRAEAAGELRDQAFAALERTAETLAVPVPDRMTTWTPPA